MGITVEVLHTGRVCVSKYLPFGGDDCSLVRASGLFGGKSERMWLPVSCYLITHPRGRILVDTGWHRSMSSAGVFDARAQIKSLDSRLLYRVNQGEVEPGAAIDEQLAVRGISPADLDFVLLSHLDCDHANGLSAVADAKRILVSTDELAFASKFPNNMVRYRKRWWDSTRLETFTWNGTQGPADKSFDLFGDGSVVQVNIPGHADGLCATKITGSGGHFVLLFSDGGYAARSWREQITSGTAADKQAQKRSLAWIREQSLDPRCVESLANHDPDVRPYVIELA